VSGGNGKPRSPLDLLTPIQRRMLDKLSDGKEHYSEELLLCLANTEADLTNIHAHLTAIRKLLYLEGKAALVTHKYGPGNTCYQLIPLSAVMPHPTGTASSK
jgi:hypothetical protein